MAQSVNLRGIILDILMEVNEKDAYSHVTINSALKKYQYLDKNERAFISKVSQGTIEKMIYIDEVINSFSKVRVAKMKPVIRNIMRMSVYQLLFLDGVPESAVCNEAVKLADKRGFHTLKGFVNGVLRNISRNKDNLNVANTLSVKYSLPQWIVDYFTANYGDETSEKIFKGFEEERPTYVRCNTLKYKKSEIIESLKKQGVTVNEVPGLDDALMISDYDFITGLDAFRNGCIYVQDISSMLVGHAASPKANDIVIDVCAAPGGKSINVALMLNGTGQVKARDISANKVMMMQEMAQRLGISNMSVEVCDALSFIQEDEESADIVICDLPCSGLGIIGRKADIKYKMTKEKQDELVLLQRNILRVASRYVKPGGRLVFSTCTINKCENEDNYRFIIDELGFKPESLSDVLPEEYAAKTAELGYVQLLPGIHHTDGFFISRFIRE